MTKQHEREEGSDQTVPNAPPPVLQPGSDAWWEARLTAIAGGRTSALESNDWVGDFNNTTTTDDDDSCGDLTDDLASTSG